MGTATINTPPVAPQAILASLKATGQLASAERQRLLEIAMRDLVLHLVNLGIDPPASAVEILVALDNHPHA